jgi:hypothetical protein
MQLRSQVQSPGVGAPPAIDPDIWKPVSRSLGSRDPALRSRASSTGFIVQDDRILNFESRPEKFAGETFVIDPDMLHVIEQPPRIPYRDGASWRHHTFDFYTVRRSSLRTLVAIKHSSRVERSGIRRVIKLVSEQAGRGAADEIVLMTELDFSPAERFNAELVHERQVREATADINGSVTVLDVVAMSELGGVGFRAVVRLIADRFFQLADPQSRIDYDARIRRF